MQNQSIQITSQSKVKYTLSNFVLHSFVAKNKSFLSEGNCLILQSKKGTPQQGSFELYIKFNNYEYCKRLSNAIFIKVRYQQSISYLFFDEKDNNLIYSISSYTKNNDVSLFQGVLTQNASLIDYEMEGLSQEYKEKINQHISKVKQNEIIINWTTTTKIAKGIGSLFGKFNDKVTKATKTTDQVIHQKVDRFTKDNFSENTHSKWQTVIQKADSINKTLAKFVNPITNTIQSAAKDIGKSITTSENKFLKGMTKLTQQVEGAINQGFNSEQVNSNQLKEEANMSIQPLKNSVQIKQISAQYPTI